MLLFISIAIFFLSSILLFSNARRFKSSVYIGLFFLFLSFYVFSQYVLLYSGSVWLISHFLIALPFIASPVYLIGPMLYLYIRSILTDNSKLQRRDFWHFLPMIIYFLATVPNTFVPWAENVELAERVVENPDIISEYRATVLTKIFPPLFVFLSRLFLILGYALWSFGLFINFIVNKRYSTVLSKQHFMKKWLFQLLGFLLVLVISQIFLVIRSFDMHFVDLSSTIKIIRTISGAGLIGLLISPFFFPAILYGLPRLPESTGAMDSGQKELPGNSAKSNKPSNSYECDYLRSIGHQVDSYMKEHQLYLNPDCNLAYFSKLMEVPAHHVAYYFREVKKQRFNDFRNEWRIQHAKTLIKEGKATEMTLEAIGSLSGFTSRNAFTTDFKKIEGISPGAYAARYN